MSSAKQMMTAARTSLVLDNPFFGALSLRLRLLEDPSHPTAWVDGETLGFNPAWVEKLAHAELVGLVAHEVMHCALGHPWRRDAREHERFNEACDYAINGTLKRAGFTLPAGGLLDALWDGKSAEFIYDRLPAKPPGQGRSKPNPQGEVCDAPKHGHDGDGAPGESNEVEWQIATQQAAQAALARGDLPAELKRLVKEVAAPRVNWRSVLRRFVQQCTNSDYRWTRPSSRYLARGLYMPSLRSEELPPIVVAVDTSGSIDEVMLAKFGGEIQAIAEETRPVRVVVMYCDTKVHRTDTFERDDPIELEACGGGGTAFEPVFQAVAELDEQPACIVYLTDLCGSFPEEAPETPTLWATVCDGAAPFGEVVLVQ